jgi:hypothetical protein
MQVGLQWCFVGQLAEFMSPLQLIMRHAILVHCSKFGSTQWPNTSLILTLFFFVRRGKNELESDFRRLWEEFRSSSSEKVHWHLFYFFHHKSIIRPCELVLALTLYSVFPLQEKERALNLAVDVFCRLVKQYSSVAQLVTKYDSLQLHTLLSINYAVTLHLFQWVHVYSLF